MPPPSRSLVICTQARSGSYLLCDLLAAGGILPRADEWLVGIFEEALRAELGLSSEADRLEYLAALVNHKGNSTGWFGIKILGWNFWPLMRELRVRPEFAGAGPLEIVRRLFPHPRFIDLRRRDQVAQAVSLARARQTRRWHRRHLGQFPGAAPLVYSYSQIHRARRATQRSEQGWDYFFASQEVEPFRLVYEDLIADPEGTLRAIHAWLDLPPPLSSPALEALLNRGPQRDAVNHEWAERYAAERLEAASAPTAGTFGPRDFTVAPAERTLHLAFDQAARLEFTVCHQGPIPWRGAPPETENDEGMLCLHAELPGRRGLDALSPYLLHALPTPLREGEVVQFPVFLCPLDQPGRHELAVRVVQRRAEDWVPCSDPVPLILEVGAPPHRAVVRTVFADLEEPSVRESRVPGWGAFRDDLFPWIYHHDHGWLEVDADASAQGKLRFHDAHLGWVRTAGPEFNPWQVEGRADPLVYEGRQGAKRRFREPSSGRLLLLPFVDVEAAEQALAARQGRD